MTPDELNAAVAKVEVLGFRIGDKVAKWQQHFPGMDDVVSVSSPEVIAMAALTRGWIRAGCPDADGWLAVAVKGPPEGTAVETKIDDADGVRNVATLRRSGRLWFLDGGLRTYYEPTHWRPLDPVAAVAVERERWAAEAEQRADTLRRQAGDIGRLADESAGASFRLQAAALERLAADLNRPPT